MFGIALLVYLLSFFTVFSRSVTFRACFKGNRYMLSGNRIPVDRPVASRFTDFTTKRICDITKDSFRCHCQTTESMCLINCKVFGELRC
jgi:hypothetical protein